MKYVPDIVVPIYSEDAETFVDFSLAMKAPHTSLAVHRVKEGAVNGWNITHIHTGARLSKASKRFNETFSRTERFWASLSDEHRLVWLKTSSTMEELKTAVYPVSVRLIRGL